MYDTHVKQIAEMAKEDHGLESVVRFVLHTIRRSFYQVNVDNSLSKAALQGYRYTVDNGVYLRQGLEEATSLEEKVRVIMQIKGLNIPKAAFVLQMLGEPIGCIDTHNARLLGVDSNDLLMDKSRQYKPEKVWRYIGMCHSSVLEGPKNMWDNWCSFIADKYPKHFADPESVSQLHVDRVEEFMEASRKGMF